MAAQVLTFHMAYEGLEDRIWRDVEISSKMRLDQLGYVVLATFDTLAYHLFKIELRGKVYGIPMPDEWIEQYDLADFTLKALDLNVGEQMELVYDFGTEQHFFLTLTAVREMKRGEARHFPWVTAMNGRGIIDDMHVEELKELVAQIDKNGKTDEQVYYDRYGMEDPMFLPAPWDVNRFDLKTANGLLKYDVKDIEGGYAPFWEEMRQSSGPAARKKKAERQPQPRLPVSDYELCDAFFEAVLCQKPEPLRKLFSKNAVIEWPCTNERFTVEEYVRANCEYPGQWEGEIVDILSAEKQIVLITKVWTREKTASHHCISILRRRGNKIAALTEYWSEDGPAPEWRQALGIGSPAETEG